MNPGGTDNFLPSVCTFWCSLGSVWEKKSDVDGFIVTNSVLAWVQAASSELPAYSIINMQQTCLFAASMVTVTSALSKRSWVFWACESKPDLRILAGEHGGSQRVNQFRSENSVPLGRHPNMGIVFIKWENNMTTQITFKMEI